MFLTRGKMIEDENVFEHLLKNMESDGATTIYKNEGIITITDKGALLDEAGGLRRLHILFNEPRHQQIFHRQVNRFQFEELFLLYNSPLK